MQSPFFPRIINNGLPPETHSLILHQLYPNAVSRLRSTCVEMNKDTELERIHQLNVQKALTLRIALTKSLQSKPEYSLSSGEEVSRNDNFGWHCCQVIVDDIEESIHDFLVELKDFSEHLRESFYNKNVLEAEEESIEFKTCLLEERDKYQCEPQDRTIVLKSDETRRLIMFSLLSAILVDIKFCILEQETAIAIDDLKHPFTGPARSEKVEYALDSDGLWCAWKLERLHSQENVAALFSSRPDQIQAQLKEQHELDTYLRYTLLKSCEPGFDPIKQYEIGLLEKKYRQ